MKYEATLKLEKLASNLHKVSIGTLELFYSYKTVIAFKKGDKFTISENIWSHTTGKHINAINGDKSERLVHDVFLKRLQNTLELYEQSKRLASI